ncbi:hypothetical protein ACOSQ2_012102 [Xanthoceras sorbifolium]
MLIFMSNTPPNYLTISPFNRPNSEKLSSSQNGFICYNPSSKLVLASSHLESCATKPISASLTKTIDHKTTDCNTKIRRFCEVGNLREAMQVLYDSKSSRLDSGTYCSVLQLCADYKSLVDGQKVHSIIRDNGIVVDGVLGSKLAFMYVTCGDLKEGRRVFDTIANEKVFMWNLIMNEYSKMGNFKESVYLFKKMIKLRCGKVKNACKLFDEMNDRDVVSWNSMISGYAANGLAEKGFEMFIEMLNSNFYVDLATMIIVLSGCVNCGDLEFGRTVHTFAMKSGFSREIAFNNTLLDMYAKCGDLDSALGVFEKMRERSVVSWTSMIAGYARKGVSDGAIRLFRGMEREDAESVYSEMPMKDIVSWNTMIGEPDGITMACILPACASLAALERGREIHGYILRNGYSSDKHVLNAIIDMYAKCGVLVLARLLFDMISIKDIYSWTVMIAGYGMHGFGSEAIAAFNDMRRAGIEPDEVSFISVLYACVHSGLVDEGWRFFNIMRYECKIEPKLEHYGCMVDLLSRSGNLSKAYRFIEMMPIAPDATIWGALLRGCRIHHDVKLAEKVAEHVFMLEPENKGYYVLLANIYAEAEKWEEVKNLRDKIGRRRGLKKNQGCSWIEIKGKVNIFTTGDNSHPQAKKIESLLKKLRLKMEEEGYFPKIRYALINTDEMEQEVSLCGHSEKLAMAFGILSLPPGKTIRVTKNLKVCNDCHEMARFMSKTARREIVLRDSNRFHHFKDGHCSCRGFW